MLRSNSAPMVQPPGKGIAPPTFHDLGRPKKTWPNWMSSCSLIQTTKERKYSPTTVQMPLSICARVPKNTSTSDKANSVTVIRSDPSTSRISTSGCFWREVGCGDVPGTREAVTALVRLIDGAVGEVSFIGGSGNGHDASAE